MKAIGQYFPVVLSIMLHKVVLTFEIIDEILIKSVNIQMKATEQRPPVVLFIILCLILWMKSQA